MQTQTKTLSQNWRFREIPAADTAPHNQLPWLPAVVPNHVHLDLMRAGIIPDPFVRMHERDVQWVDERDWVYQTTFEATENQVEHHSFLRFNGLDTVAEIVLNGTEIGRADNMFIPHEFSVDGNLKVGENTLTVTFRSAKRIGEERHAAWDAAGNETMPGHWDGWAARSFVRKAQYGFGWDWGPVLRSCGLWQKVELVTVSVAQIRDWKYDYEFVGESTVNVTVTVDVERFAADTPINVKAGFVPARSSESINLPADVGRHQLTFHFQELSVKRWSAGEDNDETRRLLYIALQRVEIEQDKPVEVDSVSALIGFRTIELVREPDAGGEGFKFRVNGVDTFIKGANWIPNSSFPSLAVTWKKANDALHIRLLRAKEAGFNMLRVWGGGLYESEEFYNLCDRFGILVWQDFPYGCAYYPDTGEYADAARAEATAAVRRIRNHPCLALWCGNNENHQMFHDDWHGQHPPRLLGEKLYDGILPEVLAAEDRKTPYINGSPTGGENPNDPNFGDCHNWDVWHGRGDWTHYPENDCRFSSEFGFASSCGLRAWDSVLDAGDKWPDSPAVQWHDKTRKGYETYRGYVALHYPHAQTLEDWVYYSQLNQADALKCGIEHHRRRKGRCWGTLFWQFNDCWPAQSWAIVDSLGDPKAAYFACKRFYAPALLSLARVGDTVEAHLTNDTLEQISGPVTLTLETFDGETLATQTFDATVDANGTANVGTFPLAVATGREDAVFVHAQFADVSNILLLDEPKNLRLPTPGLTLSVADDLSVTVKAERFAPHIWLRLDNQAADFDDNFFTLRAGESRIIKVTTDGKMTADELRGQLKVRSL